MLTEKRKQLNILSLFPLKHVLGNTVAPKQAEAQITKEKRVGSAFITALDKKIWGPFHINGSHYEDTSFTDNGHCTEELTAKDTDKPPQKTDNIAMGSSKLRESDYYELSFKTCIS